MKKVNLVKLICYFLFLYIFADFNSQPGEAGEIQTEVSAIPTFESVGLYWSPDDDFLRERVCDVLYKVKGSGNWQKALPLWYDSRNKEYRGSIVNLKPGTEYEIKLSLQGNDKQTLLFTRTWSEKFPIARTIYLPERTSETFIIDQSGTEDGYILYTSLLQKKATIDVANMHDSCIKVKASYIIIRGVLLKGAKKHGIELLSGCHDVVIEGCDITGWGRVEDDGWGTKDAAIYSCSGKLKRVIIQRNKMHHPRSDSNNWCESRGPKRNRHPKGPYAVAFFHSAGNHVIRYNEIYSDENHYFQDCLGGGSNFSDRGFPHRDSDIYGNYIANCWDDAIESEGANCNVRIWGNYIEWAYVKIAVAATSIGPIYIWRNVAGISREGDLGSWNEVNRGGFLKTSDGAHVKYMSFGGKIYVFHNTILQPKPPPEIREPLGCEIGYGIGGPMLNVMSRNNILHVSGKASINDRNKDLLGDYDYDLYNRYDMYDRKIGDKKVQEEHGVYGVPKYNPEPFYNPETGKGIFTLDKSSPGYDRGIIIPNFNDNYIGSAPDIGAHEAEAPSMEFGVNAYRINR